MHCGGELRQKNRFVSKIWQSIDSRRDYQIYYSLYTKRPKRTKNCVQSTVLSRSSPHRQNVVSDDIWRGVVETSASTIAGTTSGFPGHVRVDSSSSMRTIIPGTVSVEVGTARTAWKTKHGGSTNTTLAAVGGWMVQ